MAMAKAPPAFVLSQHGRGSHKDQNVNPQDETGAGVKSFNKVQYI